MSLFVYSRVAELLGIPREAVPHVVEACGLRPKDVPHNGKAKGLNRGDVRRMARALKKPDPFAIHVRVADDKAG